MEKREPYIEERPWGRFMQFIKNEPSTVKILHINEGEEFSLQYHNHRSEWWYVVSGKGSATIGEETREIKKGDILFAPVGKNHQISGGVGGVDVLEISFGEFDENDIVRLKDKYNRT